MVGKPNFPSDVDDRDDLMGLGAPTAGLTALDQEREGSMADEGGASGAVMETQSRDWDSEACSPTSNRPYSDPATVPGVLAARRAWITAGLVAGVALVLTGASMIAWRYARA